MLAQQTIPASRDLKIDAGEGVSRVTRLALDDVMLADVECQPDNAAVAVIAGHSWE